MPIPRTAPAADAAPPRAQRPTGAAAGSAAEVNRFIAAYIMGVANRLANGASNHYRRHFGMGMSEWRTMMAIGSSRHRIVREVAEMADLDYAAASKSLKLLQSRGLVAIEQTRRRGRAAIASLTHEGLSVHRKLCRSARQREARLLAAFTADEVAQLWSLLRRIEGQVAHMNAGPAVAGRRAAVAPATDLPATDPPATDPPATDPHETASSRAAARRPPGRPRSIPRKHHEESSA